MLCKYKDALGKPKEGVHKYRIFNIAIVDVILTIILASIISWFFKLNFWLILLIVFLLGIIIHRMFCVRTTVDKLLFPNYSS
jgi:fatty acid desaturase